MLVIYGVLLKWCFGVWRTWWVLVFQLGEFFFQCIEFSFLPLHVFEVKDVASDAEDGDGECRYESHGEYYQADGQRLFSYEDERCPSEDNPEGKKQF